MRFDGAANRRKRLCAEHHGRGAGRRQSVILQMLTEADKANAYFAGASVTEKLVPKATNLEEEGYMCGPNQLLHKIS